MDKNLRKIGVCVVGENIRQEIQDTARNSCLIKSYIKDGVVIAQSRRKKGFCDGFVVFEISNLVTLGGKEN